MNQALKKDGRLTFPRREAGEVAKARPCLGRHHDQFEKAGKMAMERYESAYRKLAKV